jgi:hypothetical protein
MVHLDPLIETKKSDETKPLGHIHGFAWLGARNRRDVHSKL